MGRKDTATLADKKEGVPCCSRYEGGGFDASVVCGEVKRADKETSG